jgi:hypothetical protein
MDIGPASWLAELILILRTDRATADGNQHGSTDGESR